ncbi:MAG: GrpB family protein, partial [Bacillota bacterium]
KQAGYEHEGDLGIKGREVFQEVRKSRFLRHHLYVCTKDCRAFKEHIFFRDYLRADEQTKNKYAQLKRELAREYTYDVDGYCEAKTEFIRSILERETKSK